MKIERWNFQKKISYNIKLFWIEFEGYIYFFNILVLQICSWLNRESNSLQLETKSAKANSATSLFSTELDNKKKFRKAKTKEARNLKSIDSHYTLLDEEAETIISYHSSTHLISSLSIYAIGLKGNFPFFCFFIFYFSFVWFFLLK